MKVQDYYVIALNEKTEYRYFTKNGGHCSVIGGALKFLENSAISKLYSFDNPELYTLIRCRTECVQMEVLLEESKVVFPEEHI